MSDDDRFQVHITYPGQYWASERPELCSDENPWDHCYPTVESSRNFDERAYRHRCLGCGERGPVRTDPQTATEDGQDHAYPGWRDLPVVPNMPGFEDNPKKAQKKIDAWMALVTSIYPEGWLERGGPIRTHRVRPGNRHVPARLPGGGYDMATDEPCPYEKPPAARRSRQVEPTKDFAPAPVVAGEQLGFDFEIGLTG